MVDYLIQFLYIIFSGILLKDKITFNIPKTCILNIYFFMYKINTYCYKIELNTSKNIKT